MKKILTVLITLLIGFLLAMLYVHRRVIAAAIRGEELPKAPKGCPAYKEEAEEAPAADAAGSEDA